MDIHYFVLLSSSLKELVCQVNELALEHWEPEGAVVVAPGENGLVFLQTIKKKLLHPAPMKPAESKFDWESALARLGN